MPLFKTADQLQEVVDKLLAAPPEFLAVDLETTSLDWITGEVVGISICAGGGGAYIPLSLVPDALTILTPVLESIPLAGHNCLGFDALWLEAKALNCNWAYDTMLLAYCSGLFSESLERGQGLALKYIAKHLLNMPVEPLDSLFKRRGLPVGDFSALPLDDDVVQYATLDAVITWKLATRWKSLASKYPYRMESTLVPISSSIQTEGVLLDSKTLQRESRRLGYAETAVSRCLLKDVPTGTNLSSSKQLGAILEGWGYTLPRTKAGACSVDKETIQDLAKMPGPHQHWLENLLCLRRLSKNRSTYCDSLLEKMDIDGRIRTTYRQFGCASGRYSSNSPNLQNLPRAMELELSGHLDTEIGRIVMNVRRTLVAPPDHYFIDSDYGQVEARIAASLSQDQAFMEVFKSGQDCHTMVASMVYGVPYEDVTKYQRQMAKTIIYGWMYGQQNEGMSARNQVPQADVDMFISRMRVAFWRLVAHRDWVIQEWEKGDGWIRNHWGFPRNLSALHQAQSVGLRNRGARTAYNHLIQSTAAFIQKTSLIRLYRALEPYGRKARIIMHTHDSNVVEVHKTLAKEEMVPIIHKAMTDTIPGMENWVPLTVDSKVCERLG